MKRYALENESFALRDSFSTIEDMHQSDLFTKQLVVPIDTSVGTILLLDQMVLASFSKFYPLEGNYDTV